MPLGNFGGVGPFKQICDFMQLICAEMYLSLCLCNRCQPACEPPFPLMEEITKLCPFKMTQHLLIGHLLWVINDSFAFAFQLGPF